MRSIALVGLALAVPVGLIAAPAAAQNASIGAYLFGSDVPGGSGDKDATANLSGEIDPAKGKLCYYLDMDGLDDANAIHIHAKGDAGTAAPVLTLTKPSPKDDEACVTADKAVLGQIAAAPGDYAIDIHTPGHPDGAVRGALK